MNQLRIAENIINLRKQKKVTQDDLAGFLGVTKASVSKWENQLSYPDVLLIPQIASYFDISIDDLMGYAPQLSKEQIRKIYRELSMEFVESPFEDVMKKIDHMVKKYYSCYEFLVQIATLCINHSMLAESEDRQHTIFKEIVSICDHIIDGCKEVKVLHQAISVKAISLLQLGKATETIELLENYRFEDDLTKDTEALLVQAYQMTGDKSKAELTEQIQLYKHLISLVGDSVSLIMYNLDNKNICEETIHRIEKVIKIYNVMELNANVTLQFNYVSAIYYSTYGDSVKAIDNLKKLINGTKSMLSKEKLLNDDDYFTRISEWFEEFPLGDDAPRGKKLIWNSVVESLAHPAFEALRENEIFINLVNKTKEVNDYEY